ncbi:MAG: hypothetical protein BM556_01175 [Bacteriovorax sp. MedPE-SWde]|nr:MAG: hypothetical protein BM556_01175 [Bacteriovorax sp. MedPE-SWde]
MKTIFGIVLTLLVCFSSYAEQSASFSFNGQSNDEVLIEEIRQITLFKDEVRDGTCTRQIPYTENVCGYETNYRQECSWQAGYNNCYNDTQRDCRYETRYRRECTRGPSRSQCTMKPGKTTCRTGRDGQQRCHTTQPRRVCRDVPGRETCRRVPYQDYVCSNRTVRKCDWVPGRNVCEQVPYQEYICRDVTKYRSEDYACKVTVKVPYKVEKKVSNQIFVSYKGDLDIAEAQFLATFKDDNTLDLKTTNLNEDDLLISSTVDTVSGSDKYSFITNIAVDFFDKTKALRPVVAKSHGLWMNKGGKFEITLDNFEINEDILIEVHVRRDSGKSHYKRLFNITEFAKKKVANGKMKLAMNLGSKGFKRLKSTFGTGIKLKVDVRIKLATFADLNLNREKTHSFKIKVYKNK